MKVLTRGTVKFFDSFKGFGFISREDGGQDVYVNIADVKGGSLSDGDKVEFEVEQAQRGPRARNVAKV